MLFQIVMGLGLTFIGVVTIANEEKLVEFERAIVRRTKRFLSKPEKVIVLPRESEESKKARFETGASAGDELYAMGGVEK